MREGGKTRAEELVSEGIGRLVSTGQLHRAREVLAKNISTIRPAVADELREVISGIRVPRKKAVPAAAPPLPVPPRIAPQHSAPPPPRILDVSKPKVRVEKSPHDRPKLGAILKEESKLPDDVTENQLLFLNAFESSSVTVSKAVLHERCEGKNLDELIETSSALLQRMGYRLHAGRDSYAIMQTM